MRGLLLFSVAILAVPAFGSVSGGSSRSPALGMDDAWAVAPAGGRLPEAVLDKVFRSVVLQGYSGTATVEPDAFEVTFRHHHMVGDIPVYQATARINRAGKQVTGFFNEGTADHLGSFLVPYTQLTKQPLDFPVVQALAAASPDEILDVLVTFFPTGAAVPVDSLGDPVDWQLPADAPADIVDLQQRAREGDIQEDERTRLYDWADDLAISRNSQAFAGQLAALREQVESLDGVVGIEIPDVPGSVSFTAHATASGIRNLAGLDGIASIQLDRQLVLSPSMDQARIASGTAAANDGAYPYRGQGMKIAVYDTGVNELGTATDPDAYLDVVGSENKAPYPSIDAGDDYGHGTMVAWVIGGELAPLKGTATDASLYNEKIMNGNGVTSVDQIHQALEHGSTTWQAMGTTSIVNYAATSNGLYWWSKELDYYVFYLGRYQTVSAGNHFDVVAPPSDAFNVMSAGGYDDHDDGANPAGFTLFDLNGEGTPLVNTDDGRLKPDAAWPAQDITLRDKNNQQTTTSGNSFAAPHAAGAAADLGTYIARARKCRLLASAPETAYHNGWGWGKASTIDAVEVQGTNLWNFNVAQGNTEQRTNIVVAPGETIQAFLVWNREMSTPSTVTRISDLDLVLTQTLPAVTVLDTSLASLDNVESVWYTNNGASPITVKLGVVGEDLKSGGAQGFSLCWDIR
jgi:hypothetical protein